MRLRSLVGVLTVAATVGVVYCSSSSSSIRVSLVKNGYEGIVVAISPVVNESLADSIISSIKTMMTEASAVLFRATRNRTYFRNIKVLLPMTWASTSYDASALAENFEESDIRVEARSLYGDQPYTVRAGGCGQPGQHVVFTPEYLTRDQQAAWWGPRGKVLVHEWAKLRWGVFEEFGYPNDTLFPLLYWTNGEGERPVLMPNYCTNEKPKGSLRDKESDGPCHYHNGLPDNNCRFIPDSGQKMASSSSSLMALYYLSGTERFCDSVQEASHRHDQFAPTRHNALCGGRSVWDVLRRHPDFADGTNPPTKTWSPPTFRMLRQEVAKFILVLDHSSSMAKFDRMRKVNQTTRWWILHKVASVSFVGVVTLADETRMVKNLTQLTNMDVRKSVASLTSGHLSGSINITEGTFLALTQLVRRESNVVMVMMAAGESVVYTSANNTLKSRLVTSGIRLVMVLLGNDTNPELERLAHDMGGKSYVVPDEGEDGLLDDALLAALAYQPWHTRANTTIKIYEEVYRGNNSVRNGSFVVDSFVGRNLVFKVYTHPSHLVTNPLLLSPLNTHYDNIDEPETVHVAKAETGMWRWRVGLSGSSQHSVHVSVTSQPREAEHGPIHVLTWVGPEAGYVDATSRPAIAYAEVKQDSNPVAGARVRAYVGHPNATLEPLVVELLDSGRAADIQAGDGVYSRYLTNYSTAGRYTLKVEVSGGSNTFINTQCLTCHDLPHERPRYCCGSEVPLDCKVATPTGVFTRVAPMVVFQVTGVPPASDSYPPAGVRDLQATPSLSQVNLTWTATGDDFDAGTVSGYEVRLSSNRSDLLDSTFHLACRSALVLSLAQSWARRELLLEGGQAVTLRLDLVRQLEYDRLYFVALQATDDVGRKSRVSNVAPVMVRSPSAAAAEEAAAGAAGRGRPLRGWQVALLVLGCVIVIADLVGGFFYFVEKHYFQEMD